MAGRGTQNVGPSEHCRFSGDRTAPPCHDHRQQEHAIPYYLYSRGRGLSEVELSQAVRELQGPNQSDAFLEAVRD